MFCLNNFGKESKSLKLGYASLFQATIIGVYNHALSTDKISKNNSEIGILPIDIIKNLQLNGSNYTN